VSRHEEASHAVRAERADPDPPLLEEWAIATDVPEGLSSLTGVVRPEMLDPKHPRRVRVALLQTYPSKEAAEAGLEWLLTERVRELEEAAKEEEAEEFKTGNVQWHRWRAELVTRYTIVRREITPWQFEEAWQPAGDPSKVTFPEKKEPKA
jgi:hypothetical protein